MPIGAQNFRSFKEENYIYVDKTEYIHKLTTEGRYYFLSRPRRFGKSLLVSTLKELFLGSRELFEGLWIEDKWDWTKKRPVVHISFAEMPYQGLGLDKAISLELDSNAELFGIELRSEDIKSKFKELLAKLTAQHGKVVVLIDEYDKPIIDFLDKTKIHKAKEHREILKAFYSVLKDSEAYLQFVLITGVSKFSQVSIFSDLNHLMDLSLRKDFAIMLGYTRRNWSIILKIICRKRLRNLKCLEKHFWRKCGIGTMVLVGTVSGRFIIRLAF